MNLNVSVDDLRLGRYEGTKELIVNRLVKRRAILTDPDKEELPATFVRTELLELMVDECGKKGVVVVRAPRGFGKTTDAKFILKNSPGGIMFCNCQSTSTPRYWKGMASALGVPSTAYEEDSSWENLLADAVAEIKLEPNNNERNTSTATWMESMIERLLTMCGGGDVASMTGGNLNDLEPPSIEGLSLEKLTKRQRGILILDDFNNVHSDDILFMKHFFPIVYARGVLTFVLVRDSSTADSLLNLNGWGRIAPLSGICTDEKNLPADEDGKEPLWRRPQWTRDQLESLVLSRFEMFANIDMMEGLAIRDGQNPINVLERAEEVAQQASVL
jgi:hypothetical protein